MDRLQPNASDELNRRFDEVSLAFVEFRDFTTFSLDRLETRLVARMDAQFEKLAGRIDKLDGRIDKLDSRLDRHELILTELLNEVRLLARRA